MSPYWLHPDEWPEGGRHLRPRNHGPFPAAAPRADAEPDPDRVLALRVAEGLVRDQAVRGRRVEVTVVGTVVTLDGELESPHARSAAETCARATPGVSEVANRLVIMS
jgi:BON domain-containing protein